MEFSDDLNIRINEKFILDMIQGEEEYNGDFKEFNSFWVCFDSGERDAQGMVTLNMIKFDREAYFAMPEEFIFKIDQIADNVEHDELVSMFEENFSEIQTEIDAFIRKYESQGFDY